VLQATPSYSLKHYLERGSHPRRGRPSQQSAVGGGTQDIGSVAPEKKVLMGLRRRGSRYVGGRPRKGLGSRRPVPCFVYRRLCPPAGMLSSTQNWSRCQFTPATSQLPLNRLGGAVLAAQSGISTWVGLPVPVPAITVALSDSLLEFARASGPRDTADGDEGIEIWQIEAVEDRVVTR